MKIYTSLVTLIQHLASFRFEDWLDTDPQVSFESGVQLLKLLAEKKLKGFKRVITDISPDVVPYVFSRGMAEHFAKRSIGYSSDGSLRYSPTKMRLSFLDALQEVLYNMDEELTKEQRSHLTTLLKRHSGQRVATYVLTSLESLIKSASTVISFDQKKVRVGDVVRWDGHRVWVDAVNQHPNSDTTVDLHWEYAGAEHRKKGVPLSELKKPVGDPIDPKNLHPGDYVRWNGIRAMVDDTQGFGAAKTVTLRWTASGTPGGRNEVVRFKKGIHPSELETP